MKNEGISNLILDISDVRFIDSSGLSAILTAHRLWPDESFILTGLNNPTVKSLISVSRLDNVFTIIPTVEESIAYVTMNQIGKDLLEGTED
jgi:anti-anti-sigma factor